jgi:hypothetical protein
LNRIWVRAFLLAANLGRRIRIVGWRRLMRIRTQTQRLRGVLGRIALLIGLMALTAGRAEATAVLGACCGASSECTVTTEFGCTEAGGTYLGDDSRCPNVACNVQAAVPAVSLLGLVGVVGALGGFGLFRLLRRTQRQAASGTV